MSTEWRKFKGAWEVSENGQVKNKHGKLLKPDTDKDGYKIIAIQGKKIKVHRLVLTLFNREPLLNEQAMHLDGSKDNNNIKNLKWGTQSENELDKVNHKTDNKGSRHGKSKLDENQVLNIKFNEKNINSDVLAKKYGVTRTSIEDIRKSKTWKHCKEFWTLEKQLKSASISHRLLKGYEGACNNLHGHQYKFSIKIRKLELNKMDMLMDFKTISEICDTYIQDNLDHSTLVFSEDTKLRDFVVGNRMKIYIMKGNTTAEAIAEELYKVFKEKFKPYNIVGIKVGVWETETSICWYGDEI